MYITNNPKVALIAQKYGVDRIWVDLETLGKLERQGHIDSVKSNHSIDDIKIISQLLTTSEMLVRINPINNNSEDEINKVIESGADIIMLPMWKSLREVQQFIKFVGKRVKTTLLLETKEAVECIDQVLEYGGFDEVHIGLNDLHLSYGLDFMFELLTNGIVENLCNKFKKFGIPYGFGGVAKIGEGKLPAEKIIMEHFRLGSKRAILARSFCDAEQIENEKVIESVFKAEMKKLIDFEKFLIIYSSQELLIKNKNELIGYIDKITNSVGG